MLRSIGYFYFFQNAHIRIKVLNIHSKLSVSNSISLQFIQPQNGLFPHQNNKFHSSSIPLETSSLLNRIPSNLFDPPNKKVSGPKKKKNNKIISSFKVSNLSEKANLENPSRRVSCLGRHEQATIQQIQKKKLCPKKTNREWDPDGNWNYIVRKRGHRVNDMSSLQFIQSKGMEDARENRVRHLTFTGRGIRAICKWITRG